MVNILAEMFSEYKQKQGYGDIYNYINNYINDETCKFNW